METGVIQINAVLNTAACSTIPEREEKIRMGLMEAHFIVDQVKEGLQGLHRMLQLHHQLLEGLTMAIITQEDNQADMGHRVAPVLYMKVRKMIAVLTRNEV